MKLYRSTPVLPEPSIAIASANRLGRAFYEQPVLTLARACIGKVLVHASPAGVAAGRIVETEAYRGPEDLAAHSAGGRRTRRTEAMFGPPGRAYMFFLYGAHWAFNIVCGPEGSPHAVLVRAIEPVFGHELMAARRRMPWHKRELTSGPGRVTAALGLDGTHYAMDLTGEVIFLQDGPCGAVGRSARINVDYAGAWALRPFRFFEKGNRFVSVRPRE